MTKNLKIPIRLLLTLAIFFMVSSPTLQAQSCDAEFFGTNQGNFTIEFHNISSDYYSDANWNFGDGNTSSALSTVTHTYTAAGTYQVCVTILNAFTNCQSTTCHDISIDASGDFLDSTCYYTDCVFPGDANYDNIVNAYDVLPIALYNNALGTARPNATTNFVGQAATDWTLSTSDSVNLKHIDADGNGFVNLADLAVVQQNFTFEHDGVMQKTAEGLPLWIQFDPIVYPSNPNDPFVISAGIMIGTANDPANELLGLAFILDYDETIVDAGSVNIVYHNSSIIGQSNSAATLAIDNPSTGEIAMANARTDQTFATGFSRLATAYFTITDIVIGRQSNVKFDLTPHSIQAIDTLGQPLPIAGQESSLIFSTTSTETITNFRNINIYPNPASDVLTLELGNVYAEYIEVFDNFGRKTQHQSINQRGTIQVPVSDLSEGLYLFKIQTEDGSAVKRIYIR